MDSEDVTQPDADIPLYADEKVYVTIKFVELVRSGTRWDIVDIQIPVPFRAGGVRGAISGMVFWLIVLVISLAAIVAHQPSGLLLGLIGLAVSVWGMRWVWRGDWHVGIGLADGSTKVLKVRDAATARQVAAAILKAKRSL
jgi:hypothetical protein